MTDEDQLRADAHEIEHLLAEVQELVTPPAWQRIERLLARVVRLYGAGLAHALEHARRAGASAEQLDERVAGDELLASLLVLHGLHPLGLEARVQRALAGVRAELGLGEAELVLVTAEDGRVELRAAGPLGGGAMASRVAEAAIRRVIESVAPEVTSIDIRGGAPATGLVQLRVRREAP